MKTSLILICSGLLAFLIISCEKDNAPEEKSSGYSRGIYVVNEGAYNTNTGSISFVNEAGTVIVNDIFNAVNGRPLGDIAQSFSIVNDSLGIIVVNHSARLEIVRLATFQTIHAPVDVDYPRYFLQVDDDKGYISSGNLAGRIYILDLNNYRISDSIDVGYGPEVMVRVNNYVYVANSGGYSSDSTLSVIDINLQKVVDTIFVGQVPVDMSLDDENNLWVYCKGYTNYTDFETDSYLMKISTSTRQVQWQAKVGKANEYLATPARCAISPEGDKLYYLRTEGIYSLDTGNPSISGQPIIEGDFYGLEVHPVNGRIYGFEALGFSGNGMMKVYETNGTLFAQGMVGIGPSSAVFNVQ